MRQLLIILTLSSLLLTACGGTPTPDIAATVGAAIAATLTALPTNTPTPDLAATVGAAIAATRAAQPTNTPTSTPTPTETPIPTESPTPTDTPSPPETPGPTATSTPEPTVTPSQVIHVVQEGETLFEIAREYGMSVETLMAANNITDRGLVRVGQELTVPLSDAVAVEVEPTVTTMAPTGEGEPELGDRDAPASEAEPTGISTPTPTEIPLAQLPVESKVMVIETALRANASVAVKGVAFGGEAGNEAILVAIETQGGTGSIADETTLLEATTSFIYAYEGDQRLDIGAQFVMVQALDDLGNDTWYAVTSIDDIGLLVNGEITALEFIQRIRVFTP
jgi:LysM repeat protein